MEFLSTIILAITVSISANVNNFPTDQTDEIYRPQFHFSPEQNWSSAPNGLVYYDGEYHLFYQYNPNGKEQGYMHWGHAVSSDLIHWEHLPVAIYPDENSSDIERCTAYSGSAIVDQNNVLGKQQGDTQTLVAFYTSQQCGQRIAYSTDKGRTWEKYENNPIIPYDENDDARDPKVFWHQASKKWIMVLYRKLNENDNSKGVSIYTSEDLTHWDWKSHVPGFFEHPDLVELPVDGQPDKTLWALFDGDGSYLLGNFDGEKFIPITSKLKSDWGKNYYATQTWNNIPKEDGRVLQIAWMKGGEYPEMPFNGQMTFPSELSVTQSTDGYQLVRKPIAEIEQLYNKQYEWSDKNLIPGIKKNLIRKVTGDCLRIVGEFDVKTSNNFGFLIRHSVKNEGTEIMYNVKRGLLTVLGSTVPMLPVNNKIKLDILIDRTSVEIYANGGKTVISNCFTPDEKSKNIVLYTNGGELGVEKLDAYKLNSIWEEK